jgi:hypothetical protein
MTRRARRTLASMLPRREAVWWAWRPPRDRARELRQRARIWLERRRLAEAPRFRHREGFQSSCRHPAYPGLEL